MSVRTLEIRTLISDFEDAEETLQELYEEKFPDWDEDEDAERKPAVSTEKPTFDAWVDELVENTPVDEEPYDDAFTYKSIRGLLAELCACGGDVQWRGDWYPGQLILETDFKEHARDVADELGFEPKGWPATCIDWEQAAEELKMDYSSVTYQDEDYLYRS